MTKTCAWRSCRSDSRYPDRPEMEGVTFYPFPKPKSQLKRCKEWIRLCNRPHSQLSVDRIKKHHYVCSKHFKRGSPDPEPAGDDIPLNRRDPSSKKLHWLLKKKLRQNTDAPVLNESSPSPPQQSAESFHQPPSPSMLSLLGKCAELYNTFKANTMTEPSSTCTAIKSEETADDCKPPVNEHTLFSNPISTNSSGMTHSETNSDTDTDPESYDYMDTKPTHILDKPNTPESLPVKNEPLPEPDQQPISSLHQPLNPSMSSLLSKCAELYKASTASVITEPTSTSTSEEHPNTSSFCLRQLLSKPCMPTNEGTLLSEPKSTCSTCITDNDIHIDTASDFDQLNVHPMDTTSSESEEHPDTSSICLLRQLLAKECIPTNVQTLLSKSVSSCSTCPHSIYPDSHIDQSNVRQLDTKSTHSPEKINTPESLQVLKEPLPDPAQQSASLSNQPVIPFISSLLGKCAELYRTFTSNAMDGPTSTCTALKSEEPSDTSSNHLLRQLLAKPCVLTNERIILLGKSMSTRSACIAHSDIQKDTYNDIRNDTHSDNH